MTDLSTRLTRLGEALQQAAEADLAAQGARTRPRRRVSARAVLIAAALAIAIPGAAVGAYRLITNEDVAQSLPNGTLALAGTHPACSAVSEGVEYHCILAKPPAPEVSDWQGTVEPSVDATKHVNGGCRALTPSGLEWECYIGQAAVDQRIIGKDFLGEYAPTPGVG